ncbi:hypothetical protein Ddc_11646 [Ditylenchus destructor]|nr:hypothetical protein Ddc_11646 [Ditylenchus destructor]
MAVKQSADHPSFPSRFRVNLEQDEMFTSTASPHRSLNSNCGGEGPRFYMGLHQFFMGLGDLLKTLPNLDHKSHRQVKKYKSGDPSSDTEKGPPFYSTMPLSHRLLMSRGPSPGKDASKRSSGKSVLKRQADPAYGLCYN